MSKLDVKFCAGCRNDFYNGHNDLGVKECWSREDAKREESIGSCRLVCVRRTCIFRK